MTTQPNSKKQVLFSFLAPREGYILVDASSDEEATKIVTELMADNYEKFKIVDIRDAVGAVGFADEPQVKH